MSAPWQQQGYANYDQWALDNGLKTSTGQVDNGLALNVQGLQGTPGNTKPIPVTTPQSSNIFGDVNTPYGNGIRQQSAPAPSPAANPTANIPRLTSFNGQGYDLANPEQRQKYYNDVVGYVSGQTNQSYDQNLKNLVNSRSTQLGQTQHAQSDLETGHSNFLRDQNNQGINFNNSYNSGNAVRDQNAFSSNVFQSGVASGQGYADNQHLRGLADLQAQGDSYNNQYNNQKNLFDLQGKQFNDQYDTDVYNLDKQKSDSIQNTKDQLSSNLGYYDARQNPGVTTQDYTSKYSLTPYTAPTAPKVDLANLNPYASSATLGQSPVAQQAGKFLGASTSSLTPNDNQFGFNPDQKQKDYQSNYFKTGNPNPQ